MERQEYLEQCRLTAVRSHGRSMQAIRNLDWLKGELVIYNGEKCYPYCYKLSFGADGRTIHTAVLMSIKTGTLIEAPLSAVGEEEWQMK